MVTTGQGGTPCHFLSSFIKVRAGRAPVRGARCRCATSSPHASWQPLSDVAFDQPRRPVPLIGRLAGLPGALLGPLILDIENASHSVLITASSFGTGARFQHLAHLPVEALDGICRIQHFPQRRAELQEWDEPVQARSRTATAAGYFLPSGGPEKSASAA